MGLQGQNTKKTRFFLKTKLALRECISFVCPFRGISFHAPPHRSLKAWVRCRVLQQAWEQIKRCQFICDLSRAREACCSGREPHKHSSLAQLHERRGNGPRFADALRASSHLNVSKSECPTKPSLCYCHRWCRLYRLASKQANKKPESIPTSVFKSDSRTILRTCQGPRMWPFY
jgi:hypothetical protein